MERHESDGFLIIPFASAEAFEDWLEKNHAHEPGLWLKFAKKGRGIPTITFEEALEASACYGWVDSKMYRYDDDYYILRYQPRKKTSKWSPRNSDLAQRLIDAGRMRPAGQAQVDEAKADGRWSGTKG
ncbi:YdeI/OmpD-associated family protein [Herbidospora mongoliensis]|uniref:YdeI/OmpD-associated family protein n=1 Tax=Herbidospora mongoliensis TaxID=688067 RepID=UPI000830784F|nr:hypothetical protein [Herbidospora mongoliensis]